MASPLNDPKLEALLDRLHRQSDAQVDETDAAGRRWPGGFHVGRHLGRGTACARIGFLKPEAWRDCRLR